MVGIRTYTTLDPNIYRFPQWKNNIFYPAGSFVAVATYNPLDSEDVTFAYYVSLKDVSYDNKTDSTGTVIVDGGSWAPNDSDSDWVNHSIYLTNPWALAFDTTLDTLSADLTAKVNALTGLFPLLGIDSDVALLFGADSDFRVKDSEQDSDILKGRHDAWAWDSDRDSEAQRRLDSEIHNRKAADSDLQIQIWDNDSDILMEIHDRKAADSDLQIQIWNNDSDIAQRWHDTLGIDSDRDSDFLVLHVRADSDSDRLVNYIKRMRERDSDITLKFQQHDSDIAFLYGRDTGTGNAGFPVGAIVAFAGTTMPPGFQLADGSVFNVFAYPELFTYLGENRLPDLRNMFLRGWNNDSDGFGNQRLINTYQADELKSHSHQYYRTQQADGGNVWWLGGDDDASGANIQTATTGGDETRPRNVTVAYGIAMYTGAGIVFDSDVVEAVINIRLADYDSDLKALYDRTELYKESFAPIANTSAGYVHTILEDTSKYTDIEVFLNGVEVSQWTNTGFTFALNFALRAGVDVVTFKLRR